MVIRTYPIRVAGNSGPMENEISWDELSRRTGMDLCERTTVTKKVRRVAEFDDGLFLNSCTLNAPTELALTFADYVDPFIKDCNDSERVMASKPLYDFMKEHDLLGKIKYIGTGPHTMVEVPNV